MARARTLRPGFFTSFTLAQIPRDARLFFAGLWVEADDDGRFIDSPKALAGAIFPHDEDVTPKMATRWLDSLEKVGVVRRYQTNGGRYGLITSWGEHQKPPHPTPSKLPPPPGETPETDSEHSRDSHETSVNGSHDPSGEITGNVPAGLGLGLGSNSGLGLGPGAAPPGREPSAAPTSPNGHEPPHEPRKGDQDEDDGNPPPHPDKRIQGLIDFWMDIITKPTPFELAEAHRWIPHIADHLDLVVIEERIGYCAERKPERIRYLVAACRNYGNAQTPPIEIPDPPHAEIPS